MRVPGVNLARQRSGLGASHLNVPILVDAPGLHGGTGVAAPVETTQIAPTILALLGLNPDALQAVRIEPAQVLPELGR